MIRVVAIDWSGRGGPDQKRTIWLAEARGDELLRLENGRTRREIVARLVSEAQRDPRMIVGFDFAFSVPEWYLHERGLSPRDLWALLDAESLTPAMKRLGLAAWMNAPEPPFWTTGENHALLAPDQKCRRTENDVRGLGSQPKSVFQLVGAGQVGRGSLYGMQALHHLAAAGFRIWPFDPPGFPLAVEIFPLAVEIFPRLLTGPVRKSDPAARRQYVEALSVDLVAASSEDAFDAAISALAMARAVDELCDLPDEPEYRLEGKIWHRALAA